MTPSLPPPTRTSVTSPSRSSPLTERLGDGGRPQGLAGEHRWAWNQAPRQEASPAARSAKVLPHPCLPAPTRDKIVSERCCPICNDLGWWPHWWMISLL
ncbi:unnamed protein product [Musa acuminata subsp. burmannicoides]